MEENERGNQLERLLEVVRSLTTAPNLDSLLQAVIAEAAELTDSEKASILEYDPDANELHFLAAIWFDREVLRPMGVPLEGSVAGWVFRKGQPLVIQDARADQRHFKSVDRAIKHETKSLAAVPLIVRGKTIGVLEALNKRDDAHYTEDDLTILATLGALAAQAIRNNALERKFIESQSELAELDRLKTDFIAITSHELRTPLGLIFGHATFLKELAGDKYDSQLNMIIKNATRLKEIVENLSDVDNVRIGAARVRNNLVSLAKITEDVTSAFHDEAAFKNITLVKKIGASSYLADVDEVKINIALSNIVKNAIQFTESGGTVTITVDEDDGYVTVSVSDTGIGIPAQDLPKIFDRFFQVETHLTRKYGGMGLGLSVARSMIELHKGRIWVESEEGKGSTFTFVLPVKNSQVERVAGAVGPFTEQNK